MKLTAHQKKYLLGFAIFDFVLLILFVSSFVFKSKRNAIETKQTVLLNSSSLESISSIVLFDGVNEGKSVTLNRNDSFWSGTDSVTGTVWPADSQTVRNLIETLIQVRNVRVKAVSQNAWADLGIDEENAFSIRILDNKSNELLSLYFGHSDSLTQRMAFRTSKDVTAYETDFDIRSYLNAESSFWADPFLFPVFVSGSASVNMQSSYRHGLMLPVSTLPEQPVNTMRKTFENGARAVFSVYETEDDFIVVPQFYASQSASQTEQDAVRKCNYRYSLSQWTYEHILEDWRDE